MAIIRVPLEGHPYSIHIAAGLRHRLPQLIARQKLGRGKTLILSDTRLRRLYPKFFLDFQKREGVFCFFLSPGEGSKTMATTEKVLAFLLAKGFDRSSLLVAVGGGVVGDLGGFAAGIFMRGIPFVQVPTTLLAQVDASVGGKTGVNHALGKNMIGVFHQPKAVFIDTDFLTSLGRAEFLNGFAEVIKHGIIRSRPLFDYLEGHLDLILKRKPSTLQKIVASNCRIKADVVVEDEREKDLRAILNFGHTYGHAIETLTGYTRYPHGQAVMLGMFAATVTSRALHLIREAEAGRILSFLTRVGLPPLPSLGPDVIYQKMFADKKTRNAVLNLVLPSTIGWVKIVSNPPREAVLEGIRAIVAR